ncbi:MAG: radical SAM protein [Eubacteriales bacterium]|nr:radical SAM protein [Eubacteriales bacterium]
MFKVLLINPPRKHVTKLNISKHINLDLGEISSIPPLGLMYLAQTLRRESAQFQVEILDSVVYELSSEQVVRKVREFSPQIIGIASYTYLFYDVWKVASEIKKAFPDIPIAVGGPHMYLFPQETLTHACFDYAVAGDGEEVFARLCMALLEEKEVSSGPGLFMRRNNTVQGQGVAFLDNLDAAPFPAVDLIDYSKYYNPIGVGHAVGTICTSRGCPFQCTFCQVPHRPYRTRSVENIIREIKMYLTRGISDFFIFDDLFNITKTRVEEFSQAVLDDKLKIGWMFRGRVDQMDDAMLRSAKRAGCHTISVGVEAATNAGLKAIKKNITLEQAFEAVRLMRKNRIYSSVNWILGLPDHRSPADLEHLLEVALKIRSDYAQFSMLQCLPGSELYDQVVSEGGIDPRKWRDYVLDPRPVFEPPVWEKYLKKEQMFEFYVHAYKKFYYRPRVIFNEIARTGSWEIAWRKMKTFKKVFWEKPSIG